MAGRPGFIIEAVDRRVVNVLGLSKKSIVSHYLVCSWAVYPIPFKSIYQTLMLFL